MQIVNLNDEQTILLEKLTSIKENLSYDKYEYEKLPFLRSVLDKAVELKMPEASYVEIQVYINRFDIEMGMPAHLRREEIVGKENK